MLDDLHVVDRSPTADLLSSLVDVIPSTNLTSALGAARTRRSTLHKFRLAGKLVELRESDLRFIRRGGAVLRALRPQAELDWNACRAPGRAHRGVGGRPAVRGAFLGRPLDTDALVERFAGSDRHVADFLLDEVLDRQPDDIRDFLLSTSLLDRMRADLCEQVTGRPDAGALLRRIEAEHLFLVPLDDDREWFRYHHLFGQLLRRELRMTRPELERQGHERAAVWYAAHDQPDLAIDHLLDAGDPDGALVLLGRHLNGYLSAGRHETVRGWLGRFRPSSSTPPRPTS